MTELKTDDKGKGELRCFPKCPSCGRARITNPHSPRQDWFCYSCGPVYSTTNPSPPECERDALGVPHDLLQAESEALDACEGVLACGGAVRLDVCGICCAPLNAKGQCSNLFGEESRTSPSPSRCSQCHLPMSYNPITRGYWCADCPPVTASRPPEADGVKDAPKPMGGDFKTDFSLKRCPTCDRPMALNTSTGAFVCGECDVKPPLCAKCGTPQVDTGLNRWGCPKCADEIKRAQAPPCPECGKPRVWNPNSGGYVCGWCVAEFVREAHTADEERKGLVDTWHERDCPKCGRPRLYFHKTEEYKCYWCAAQEYPPAPQVATPQPLCNGCGGYLVHTGDNCWECRDCMPEPLNVASLRSKADAWDAVLETYDSLPIPRDLDDPRSLMAEVCDYLRAGLANDGEDPDPDPEPPEVTQLIQSLRVRLEKPAGWAHESPFEGKDVYCLPCSESSPAIEITHLQAEGEPILIDIAGYALRVPGNPFEDLLAVIRREAQQRQAERMLAALGIWGEE